MDLQTTAHYSSLTLHRKCPMAWYYRYELGLRKPPEAGAKPEMHFGSWWGALRSAEALERGRRLGSLVGKPRSFRSVDEIKFDMETVTQQDVVDAATKWWAEQPEEHQAEFISRMGEPLIPRLMKSFASWYARWGDQLQYERPLGIEVFWKRALPRPINDAAWGDDREGLPDMILLGYIDELYEDTQRGIVVARDNKTSKQLSVMGTSLDDMMDSQLQLYAWGVGPQCHEWNIPKPTATAYDRIRSTKPTTPRLTATTGKLSAEVKVYDLLTYQTWIGEDNATPALRAYLETVDTDGNAVLTDEQRAVVVGMLEKGPGRLWGTAGTWAANGKPKFGVYREDPEVVRHLQQPSWESQFRQRTLTPLSKHVITAHLRAAVDTATDIWRTQRRSQITNEAPRNLSGANCRYCDFQSLCRAQMVGGADGTYDLREHRLLGPDGRLLLEAGVVRRSEEEVHEDEMSVV